MLGKVPVPESARVCGLPAALSTIETLAERVPVAVGWNFRLIVQLAPAARTLGETGQLVVSMKSPGFAPANPSAEMVKGPVPVLVRVTV
jgi:hypothetical protein